MENHGALVGWEHRELGERILLRLESVRSVAAADDHDVDVFRMLMTRQQAGILGEYLIRASGQDTVRKSGGWFRRLFG